MTGKGEDKEEEECDEGRERKRGENMIKERRLEEERKSEEVQEREERKTEKEGEEGRGTGGQRRERAEYTS